MHDATAARLIAHFGLDPEKVVPGSLVMGYNGKTTTVTYTVTQEIEPQAAGVAMMVAAGLNVQHQTEDEPGKEPEKEGGGDG